jgi:Galactose oxidase, central domain
MKKTKYFSSILLSFAFIFSCKKYDDISNPIIKTGVVSAVTPTKAQAEGTITNITADKPIFQHGHCWSSANDVPDFRINQGKTLLGTKSSDGTFNSSITGLFPSTTYYLRSFYISNKDTIYGNDIKVFKTLDSIGNLPPNVATGADSAVAITTASIRGTVVSIGTANVSSYGHCYSSTATVPTLANTVNNLGATATAPKNFVSNLTSLTPATTYYYRAYATNSVGTSYGNVVQFTTTSIPTSLPTVSTTDSFAFPSWTSNVTVFGKLISTGNTSIIQLGHLFTSDSFTTNLTTTNTTSFLNTTVTTPNDYNVSIPNSNMRTLTTYRYKAFATNSVGTAYGNEYNYTTNFKGEETSHFPDQSSIVATNRGAGAAFNGDLFYGLGIDPFNVNATTGQWLKYSTSTGIALSLTSCPVAVQFANCFTYNSKIYTIGGIVNNNKSNGSYVLEYNPATDVWTPKNSIPGAFWGGHGFLIGNKYYVVGGWTAAAPGGSVSFPDLFNSRTLVYDLTSFSFLPNVADVPGGARGFGAAFVINGAGYVVGGFKNAASPTITNDCYKYDPSSNTWEQKANIPSSQGFAGTMNNLGDSYNNLGYVWTGSGDIIGTTYNKDICRYNPTTNTWKIINSLITGQLTQTGVGRLINKTLVFGTGINNGNVTKAIYTYK